jgi:hypothetical protein
LEFLDRIHMAMDGVQCRVLVNTVITFVFHKNSGEFLTCCATTRFPRRTIPCTVRPVPSSVIRRFVY